MIKALSQDRNIILQNVILCHVPWSDSNMILHNVILAKFIIECNVVIGVYDFDIILQNTI